MYFDRNEDIQSMLYLGMALPKKNNPGMDEGVLQQLFEYSQMETQQSNSSVCFLKSNNFEQDKEELQQRLSCGEKIFVMSSYQTIGAGQNLQYKIPKGKKLFNWESLPKVTRDSYIRISMHCIWEI